MLPNMRSYSRDKNVVLNLSATKDVVLKVCSFFCGLKNAVLEISATKHVVLKMRS